MPTFESESSVVLTPQQFYDACSRSEQLRMKNIIENEFDLQEPSDDFTPHTCCGNCKNEENNPRSLSQREFNESLIDLKESWYSLPNEEVKSIVRLAEKHKIH